jgi:branched-chain amino acid transport system permease protein
LSSFAASIAIGTVVLGSVYGIIAVGFVVLFRSTGILNFVQGAFMVLGALIFQTIVSKLHIGLYPALITAMVATALIAVATYVVFFARLRQTDHLLMSVGTVGVGILYQMIAFIIWGPSTRNYPNLIGFERLGGTFITPANILTVAVIAILAIAIVLTLRLTRLGVRMRAVADQPSLAEYVGIRVGRMSAIAWALAGIAAATGAITYTLGAQLDPASLPDFGLIVFPAIILGGIDSVGGAMAGGILLGLVGSLVGAYIGGEWQTPISYIVLLVMLLIRPRGLFGSPQVSRI